MIAHFQPFRNGYYSTKEFYNNKENIELSAGDVVAVEASPGHDVGVVSMVGELVRFQLRKKNLTENSEDIETEDDAYLQEMQHFIKEPLNLNTTEVSDLEQLKVLSVRPGITDYASIRFRKESDLLASAENPEQYCIEHILPLKLQLNQQYLKNKTMSNYFFVIWSTITGRNNRYI